MSFHYLDKYCICNGRLEETSLAIDESSSSVLIVYEVFRLIVGKPLFLEDHLRRMELSLEGLNIAYSTLKRDTIHKQVVYLCQQNDKCIGNIELRLVIEGKALKNIYLGFIPHNYPDPVSYINGISTCLVYADREKPNIKLKGTSAREVADQRILEQNCYEALLVNKDGFITEGSRSNVFFVKNNVVLTAPKDTVLEGITRKYVIKALGNLGVELLFESVHADDFETMDAAFICGTSPGVLPIHQINEKIYTHSHALLKQCMKEFNDEVKKYLSE